MTQEDNVLTSETQVPGGAVEVTAKDKSDRREIKGGLPYEIGRAHV